VGGLIIVEQTPSIYKQREFWNSHWQQWEERKVLNAWTERRAREILGIIENLGIESPRFLDFGCGKGWLTELLASLGEAHGIDLSPEAIAYAQSRRPDIAYLAGNVYEVPLPTDYFDVVVSQEVISHVENQPAYVNRAADTLKMGGYFIVTTGNKFVMDRLGNVGWNKYPPEHIEKELTHGQLKNLLSPRFRVLKTSSIIPHGERGVLRLVNSPTINAAIAWIVSQERLDNWKERAGFGWQMIFLAQKRS
jgi:2-polyprenyl-3-methyl-5-hydroxy-6-metoxy-1,4-benzoquinol methylase